MIKEGLIWLGKAKHLLINDVFLTDGSITDNNMPFFSVISFYNVGCNVISSYASSFVTKSIILKKNFQRIPVNSSKIQILTTLFIYRHMLHVKSIFTHVFIVI